MASVVSAAVILLGLAQPVPAAKSAKPPSLLVGTGVADVTPPGPMWLAAAGRVGISIKQNYSALEVKAMLIKDGRSAVLIVTADTLGFCPEISEPIYARMKAFGLEQHQIILNGSHAHSVPAVCDIQDVLNTQIYPIEKYRTQFVEGILAAIQQAMRNAKPAVLVTSESESDICVNRAGPPHAPGDIIPNADGIIDRRVRLLQVRDPGSAVPRAILTVFGCHPANIWPKDGVGAFGSEFFGFGREYVRGLYPDMVVLTAQGTGGDTMLAHFKNGDIKQGFDISFYPNIDANKEFGRRFGAAIVRALNAEATPVVGRIRSGMSSVDLPIEAPPPRDFIEKAARGQAVPENFPGLKGDPWFRRWGEWMLARYEEGVPFTETVGPYDMRVVHFGDDFTLVGLNSEVQTCIGQKTEKRLAPRRTFVLGYSNDTRAYIPCAENFAPPQNGGNWEIPIYFWWLWQTAQFKPTVDTVIVDGIAALSEGVLRQ